MVQACTEALNKPHDKLLQQEKLAAPGQIISGIAHETKNPLNFINNFSEISCELIDDMKQTQSASEKEEPVKNLHDNLTKIYDYGQRADKIINKMLMYSYSGTTAEGGNVPVN